MICTLIGSVMMLSVPDGSTAVLIPSNQPVHIYAERTGGGQDAIVHLLNRSKIKLPGFTTEQVISALEGCKRSDAK